MISFDFDKDCCGCHACMNACPVGAIKMKPNKEGFFMPNVNMDVCIKCGKCEKVCPHLNTTSNIATYSLESFKDKFLTYTFWIARNVKNLHQVDLFLLQ